MIHSGGKRDLVFFTVVFVVFYLLTASAIPYLGIRMELPVPNAEIAVNSVKPDIILALVICAAILSGGRRSVVVLGIIFGFIVDVTCSVPMVSSFCYCVCGLYAGKLSFAFSGKGAVNAVLVAVPLLLIRSVVSTFYLLGIWHNIGFADIIFGAVLPEYICNIAAVAVVYIVLSLLMRIFRIEKVL